MKRLTVLAFSLVHAFAFAACTTSQTGTPGASSGGPSTSGGPTTGEGTDGGGGGGSGPAAATKTGTISLSQTTLKILDQDHVSYTGFATFIDATGSAVVANGTTSAACPQSTDGDCSITACDSTGLQGDGGIPVVGDAGPPGKRPTAGDITVTADKTITLSPGADGNYAPKTDQSALWTAGANVSVKAAGAEIPTFEKAVTGPGPINVAAPVWPSTPGQPLAIDRANDLAVTWTNGSAGNVTVLLASTQGAKSTTIICKFKADAGSGTISKAALGKLVATNTGTMSITVASSDTVAVDGWNVSILASASALTAAGTPASGLAAIQ